MAHFFVTGATGFIGGFVIKQLIAQKHRVTCLVRASSNLQWLNDLPVTLCYGSTNEPGEFLPYLREAEFILHVAGVTKARDKGEFYRGNAQATEALLSALPQSNSNLQRFVLVSSQGAVGPSPGESPIDESHPASPLTDYGRSKLQAEIIARSFMDRIPVTIVRPPAVYGPRDKDTLNFFRLIKRGLNIMIGKVDQRVNMVYVEDLAAGIIQAALSPAAAGKTYFLCEKQSYLWSEVAGIAGRIMTKKYLTIRLPFPLVYGIAFFLEIGARAAGRTTILNRQKMAELKQPFWVVSPENAERDFDYVTRFSLDQGIQSTISWYREKNWL